MDIKILVEHEREKGARQGGEKNEKMKHESVKTRLKREGRFAARGRETCERRTKEMTGG
jgi:hypothetical protein